MDLKKNGRKQVEEQVIKMDKYGMTWDRELLKSKLEYYSSTFLMKYLVKK